MDTSRQRRTPDRVLIVLCAIAGVQGASLIAYGFYEVLAGVTTGKLDSNLVVQIAVFEILGAGMLFVAWGWWNARRWSRGPFVLAQLLSLAVGIPLASSQGSVERYAGITLTLMAIIGVVLALTPVVTRAVEAGDR